MQVSVIIDDDLMAELKRISLETNKSFREVLVETIRRGLALMQQEEIVKPTSKG